MLQAPNPNLFASTQQQGLGAGALAGGSIPPTATIYSIHPNFGGVMVL